MKKRIVSALLCLCMAFSLLPMTAWAAETARQNADQACENPFQDVKDTDWYYDAVQYAWVNGFFNGTSPTAFSPDGTMTRGMFVTVLGRMAGVDPADYTGETGFTDVPAGQYYAPYVVWAARFGITNGVGGGKFAPNATISRQEMATFFVRYSEQFDVTFDTGENITTEPADLELVAPYAREAVLKLWKSGLLNGDGVNVDPAGNATRAQAATLCMRVDRAVEIWYKEPGVPSDRVSVDPNAPAEEPETPTVPDGDLQSCAVQFYDGNRLIDTLYTYRGMALSQTPSVEKYSRADAIFTGWYTDPEFTTPFYAEEPVESSMAVYARYEELEDGGTLNLTSYAKMDQEPGLSFVIRRLSGSVPAENAAELAVMDGSDPVDIRITDNGDGTCTVAAEGGYHEGCSYQLTLADGWVFVDGGEDKPDTIRTASFSIAMEEVANLEMSDSILYIHDTADISYTVGGKTYEVLTSDLGDQGGTFSYGGELPQVGDLLCIYVGTHPAERDSHNGAQLLDPAVYVKVSAVSGDTVTFTGLEEGDQREIYNIPDNFPIQVAGLPIGETGTVNLDGLDAAMYAAMMGEGFDLAAAREAIAPGDFVTLYVSSDTITGESDLYYGQITAYDAETGVITYTQTTRQAILESMDLYANVGLEGSDLITEEERAELESVLLEQVRRSGFAEDAAYMLVGIVTRSNGFRMGTTLESLAATDKNGKPISENELQLMNIGGTFELSDDIELTVELINEGDQLHFEHGSVQMAVGVDAVFEVEAEDGKIAIDLSATFVQEVGLDPRIKGRMVYKEILWIPVPIGVNVNASIDVKSFTAISLDAKIYTVAEEEQGTWAQLKEIAGKPAEALGLDNLPEGLVKGLETVGDVMDKIDELKENAEKAREAGETFQGYLEDAEALWAVVEENGVTTREAWEAMGEALGKTSITSDLLDLMNLSQETELSAEYYASMQELMDRYCEMIEQESDWIKLVDAQILMVEINILGVVMGVEARFIVRTDMSLAIGSNLQYEVGKRFNFWFSIGLFEPSGGTSSMDLIDEQFAFQFYAMGRIALKAGIRARCYTGIGSKAFASAGYALELGPYVKAYGFFVYEYTKHRAANTDHWIANDRMAGAVFMEFGLYFRVGYEANLLGSLIDIKVDFFDVMIPLLHVGEPRYCYMFDYQPGEGEMVLVKDGDGDSTNGIVMALPDSMKTLRYVDLNSGRMGYQVADGERYLCTVSNPNFAYDPQTGFITVTVPENTRYMECDLTLTYRYGKMAFSTYDMSVTIPLVWTNLSTQELSEYYTASVRVGNVEDGYETVWSKRVLKNQEFDLPTEEEIRELIGWNDYRHTASTGYGSQATTGLTLIEDTAYDYEVDYKTYDLTVTGIQNADGSTRSETYTAKFGERFDFSNLAGTGTVNHSGKVYTLFYELTNDREADLTQPINRKLADALAAGLTAEAAYTDNSAVLTFQFTGLSCEDLTMTVQRGTLPPMDGVYAVADDYGMSVKDIFPETGKVTANTTYQVVCGELDTPYAHIIFHANGGSKVEPLTRHEGALLGALPAPTRTGRTFAGWYTADGREFAERKMPVGGAEVYAAWTANEYTVTFHVNGGNALDENTGRVTYGSAYGVLPVPTRTGYGFTGWFTAAEGGEQITADTVAAITGDQTLYAHWVELKDIPSSVFDFGPAEGGTYSKGQAHEVVYDFTPEEDEAYTEGEFTFKYMRQGSSEYVDEPVNAGTYNVTVSRPADNTYGKFEQTYTAVITIDKAVRNLGVVDIECLSSYTWLDLHLKGSGGIDDLSPEASFTYQVVKKAGTGPDGHTCAGADRSSIVTGLFPGTEYYVTVKVTDDPNYEDAQSVLEGASVVSTLAAPAENWADHGDTSWYHDTDTEFTLTTAAQLAGLAQLVNGGNTFAGRTVNLGSDIDLRAYAWTPIGARYSWSGTFDGNGHTISGLYADCSNAGLFGYVRSAAVADLTLKDSYVSSAGRAGGIAAYVRGQYSRIENCAAEETVTVYGRHSDVNNGGGYGAGGILGRCYDENLVAGCTNRGAVYGVHRIGGIVGLSDDANIIVNCVNYGPVTASSSYIGGITGFAYDECKVMNSANFGAVKGSNCVGGIVGKTQTKKRYTCYVLNCYSIGTVRGNQYVGAIAGGRNTTEDAIHQCYYLEGCASNRNGPVKAVGINGTGSTDDQKNLQIACFTTPNGFLNGNGGCGSENLITALNNWVKWWNDYQCSAEWVTGEDGYPLPVGPINTNKGTKA